MSRYYPILSSHSEAKNGINFNVTVFEKQEMKSNQKRAPLNLTHFFPAKSEEDKCPIHFLIPPFPLILRPDFYGYMILRLRDG